MVTIGTLDILCENLLIEHVDTYDPSETWFVRKMMSRSLMNLIEAKVSINLTTKKHPFRSNADFLL